MYVGFPFLCLLLGFLSRLFFIPRGYVKKPSLIHSSFLSPSLRVQLLTGSADGAFPSDTFKPRTSPFYAHADFHLFFPFFVVVVSPDFLSLPPQLPSNSGLYHLSGVSTPSRTTPNPSGPCSRPTLPWKASTQATAPAWYAKWTWRTARTCRRGNAFCFVKRRTSGLRLRRLCLCRRLTKG